MSEFFGFLKVFVGCSTVFFVVTLVLLALPQSRLRCVGLEMSKWLLVAGMVVLVASPMDLIPVLPIDDIGYVIAGLAAAKSALGERRKRLLYEEIELNVLRRLAGDPSLPDETDEESDAFDEEPDEAIDDREA